MICNVREISPVFDLILVLNGFNCTYILLVWMELSGFYVEMKLSKCSMWMLHYSMYNVHGCVLDSQKSIERELCDFIDMYKVWNCDNIFSMVMLGRIIKR